MYIFLSNDFFLYLLYYFVSMSVVLQVCLSIMCISDAHGRQRKTKESLNLELQMTKCHHVGAKNQTLVL